MYYNKMQNFVRTAAFTFILCAGFAGCCVPIYMAGRLVWAAAGYLERH